MMKNLLKKSILVVGLLTLNSAIAQGEGATLADFDTDGENTVGVNGANITAGIVDNTLINSLNNTSKVVRVTEEANSPNWNRPTITKFSKDPVLLDGASENGRFFTVIIRSSKTSGSVSMILNSDFNDYRVDASYTQEQDEIVNGLGGWIGLEFDFTGKPDIEITQIDLAFDFNADRSSSEEIFEFDNLVQNSRTTLDVESFDKSINGLFGPNPASEEILLSDEIKTETYKVIDFSGATVLEAAAEGSLDVTSLSNGIYFLVTDSGVAKFVKK